MVTDKLKQLEATKQKLEKLEKSIAASRRKELLSLPSKMGFSSVRELVGALVSASGGSARGFGGSSRSASASRGVRYRAVITPATHAEVKKLVEAGKTGAEIAKTLGISVPSVHNIKKALGLVKSRK